MKTTKNIALILSLVGVGIQLGTAQSEPAAPTQAPEAQIVFQSTDHSFGKITGGQAVKHEFIFTNTGNAVLEINSVAPSCGCTTAGEWTKRIEPGQTGVIPLQFNSGSFSGTVSKHATVMSNAKNTPSVTLNLHATIWKPLEVNPQFAVINANKETLASASTSVRVVNNDEVPLTLSNLSVNNSAFEVALKTNQPGKEYELKVTVAPSALTNTGNMQGQISASTSSTNTPTISVTAMVMFQPVLMIMPPQINLPQGPLATPVSQTISIRNNGTNTLALSDVTLNIEGIVPRMQEVEPGKLYTIALPFPAGFQVPSGKSAELTLKSNHRDFPEIKVPINQPVPPAPVASPTSSPATPAPAATPKT